MGLYSALLARPVLHETSQCEDCNKPAVARFAGEQDSFGTEWREFCAEHAAQWKEMIRQEIVSSRTGRCQGTCNKNSDMLSEVQDVEEPWSTMMLCPTCRREYFAYWED